MKGAGFPNLQDAYQFLSKKTELDVARGSLDPKAPVFVSQEEPEEMEKAEFTRIAPIMIHNKDYSLIHGLMVCGTNLTLWMHCGELWVRHGNHVWNGKDCLTVTTYDDVKRILAEGN